MKNFYKNATGLALMVVLMFGFVPFKVAQAAATPSLGSADVFSVLATTFQHNGGLTTLSGSLGYAGEAGGGPLSVGGTTEVNNATWTAAGGAQNNTLATGLDPQVCTFNFASGAIDLATDTTHGQIGVYTPGVYCVNGAASIGTGGIVFNGVGTYIFRIAGALTTTDNSIVSSAGASSCDVFWTPTQATTLGANTTFIGNIIDPSGITIGSTTTINGRALAYGGTVTTTDNTINSACVIGTASVPALPNLTNNNTITVFKQIINDNGGTAVTTDFPLFINGNPVISGQSVNLVPGIYTITETNRPGYTRTFTGNCDVNGRIVHGGVNTHNSICTIVNNDVGVSVTPAVPPFIDLIKTANPVSLPAGSGQVIYTYTLSNIGTVPVTNVTIIGDTCSPVNRISGDLNSNLSLDLDEVWVYTCTKIVSETHTNTAVATGWANGISAVDVASATVLVGTSAIPPLIHILKMPNYSILPTGAGTVIYYYSVTNPGTAPLSDVHVTDDKCLGLPGRVSGHPGDLNQNNLLDNNEVWNFTCPMNLTQTTTNTAIAYGSANGLIATDFALATVVVANTPTLPATGYGPADNNILNIIIPASLLMILSFLYFNLRKTNSLI